MNTKYLPLKIYQTFYSYNQYVKLAAQLMAIDDFEKRIICFDSNNNYCLDGNDFSKAAYPIIAYELIRVSKKI